jgi:hypothetical protein
MTDTSSKLVLLRCSGINEDHLAMLERNGGILLSHSHFQGKSARTVFNSIAPRQESDQ